MVREGKSGWKSEINWEGSSGGGGPAGFDSRSEKDTLGKEHPGLRTDLLSKKRLATAIVSMLLVAMGFGQA